MSAGDKSLEVSARHDAERAVREEARLAAREAAVRRREDERGRDLLKFAGSQAGRAEFEVYRRDVLARRGELATLADVREASVHIGRRITAAPAVGGGGPISPLHVVKGVNPRQSPPPSPAPAGSGYFWVKYGASNGVIPTDIDLSFLCSLTGAWRVWADITLNGAVGALVDEVVFTVRAMASPPVQPTIGPDGTLPATAYVPLARIVDGVVENEGAGSIFIGPQVKALGSAGELVFHLSYVRF